MSGIENHTDQARLEQPGLSVSPHEASARDHQPRTEPFTAVDYVLSALTIPLLLFVLMFVTSTTANVLDERRVRRPLLLGLLALELLFVLAIVALVRG